MLMRPNSVGLLARLALLLVIGFGTPVPAAAQGFPTKPVRLISPFPPGGGTDTIARLLGQSLSEKWGQPVIIVNRPGAGGNIASDYTAKAPKDGYTLLMGVSTALTVNPSLYPDLPFDTRRDFAPIALICETQYILVVNPSLPVRSVKELIDYAKAKPGALNYATGGVGSALHLAGALFVLKTGTDIVHLPFKGGVPASVAVMGGDAQILFGSFASTLPNIQSGNLRALAVTGPHRSPVLPDVPTMDEAGLSGFNVTGWYGIMAPAGTPKSIIDKIATDIDTVMAEPEIRKTMDREGYTPLSGDAAQFAALLERELTFWSKVIKDAGIKMD